VAKTIVKDRNNITYLITRKESGEVVTTKTTLGILAYLAGKDCRDYTISIVISNYDPNLSKLEKSFKKLEEDLA
jgi:spore coat polysaccharide biosynthesis predicted glycosyltransferase SpsG